MGSGLRACEAEINRELADSPVRLVRDLGEHVALAGGKRLRPILVLLGAALGRTRGPRAVRLGCVVELLHTATLIHDDVVDQAPLRRGRPSANARFGATTPRSWWATTSTRAAWRCSCGTATSP